jgi:rubrerythrin
MKTVTENNLKDAFAGESQAHIRYLNFADRAEHEGLANVARLFRAAAFSEQIHAGNHLRALDGIDATGANLAAAFGGETFEVDEMYMAYIMIAEAQGEKRAQRSMTWADAAEKVHAALYAEAKAAVDAGHDNAAEALWVCGVCGYTGKGEPPDVCPICGARHDRFECF